MKKVSVYALITLLIFAGSACQEDEPEQAAPLPLPELLTQGFWELEEYTTQFAGQDAQILPLDYCDIDTWAFYPKDSLFIIYVRYRAGFSQGEECNEPQYQIIQSYQLDGDELILEGPRQEFTEDWDSFGFTVSNLRMKPVQNEKIQLTFDFEGSDPKVTGGKYVKGKNTWTFFLSSRSE